METKRIDIEGKTKLSYSGIAARTDINKEYIISTNNRFEKYFKGNDILFNTDATCLRKNQIASKYERYKTT